MQWLIEVVYVLSGLPVVKYGWNRILSAFEFNLIGLLDPVLCKKKILIIVIIITINRNKKCNLKNQDKLTFRHQFIYLLFI